MEKKQKERSILSLIYDQSDYSQVVDSEHPDFRINHKGSNVWFGVEVTEFHISEALARLRTIPGYMEEIVNENKHRHKRDKVELKTQEFSVTSAEGTPKGTVRAILHKAPTMAEYAEKIADTITNKEAKSNEYDKDLNHVNLIIFDAGIVLFNTTLEEFHGSFFTASLRDALYKSDFREVFLITKLKDREYVYIPLKMVLLFSQFHMFNMMISEYFANEIASSSEEVEDASASFISYMLLFGRYLKRKTENIRFRRDDDRAEVILGNTGLSVSMNDYRIIDYYDYILPMDTGSVEDDAEADFLSSSEFLKVEQNVLTNFTFNTDIANDVKGEVKF